MTVLNIDIETYSATDLTKSGVYKYAQDPTFEILLFAYAFDDEPVQVIDLASGEELPLRVKLSLTDPGILKTAFNASFERTCLRQYLEVDPKRLLSTWECTMVKSSMLGLPLSLDAASKALKLDMKKDATGKALIKYFSMPCKPTKVNGERTRNLPHHNPEKWEAFKEYCRQDVVVEKAIRDKISFFAIPETEKKLWCLDQAINDNGVLLDPAFVTNAISLDASYRDSLTKEAIELTGLDNPNSVSQLTKWLTAAFADQKDLDVARDETGVDPYESYYSPEKIKANEEYRALAAIDVTVQPLKLRKEDIPVLLAASKSKIVTRVLQIRQEMAKTSIKKYSAMLKGLCSDNRVRGLLQFYGANRTGRWAGRLVQVQNLPQNHLPDLDLARQLVKENDLDLLELLFGNVPDTLSQLIRTSFVAPEGYKFLVADFSAIEARVIAWLAGEKWRLDVFATHGKIYEASAAQMFKVPLAEVDKKLRQKGKVAELALGYQGGVNALIAMGALKMGLVEDELPAIVAAWRKASPAIVRFWNTAQNAAVNAVEGHGQTIQHNIKFFIQKGILFIQLPSGRCLSYLRPKLKTNRFGSEAITYEGMDQTTKQWGIQETYGGKLVENIVQAVARDCLAEAMLRLDAAGYKVVIHVHDEVVIEVPESNDCIEEVNKILSAPISWAKGLQLKAESFESTYYKKD